MGGAARLCERGGLTFRMGPPRCSASFSFTLETGPVGRSIEEEPVPPRPSAGRGAGQLWFFGLTAMTLLFAALLILAQLTRGGILAASVAPILFAYAIGIAVLGVGALAYVVAQRPSARLPCFGRARRRSRWLPDPGCGSRPTVPPRRRPLPARPELRPIGAPWLRRPSSRSVPVLRSGSPPSRSRRRCHTAPAAVSSSVARRTAVQTIRMPQARRRRHGVSPTVSVPRSAGRAGRPAGSRRRPPIGGMGCPATDARRSTPGPWHAPLVPAAGTTVGTDGPRAHGRADVSGSRDHSDQGSDRGDAGSPLTSRTQVRPVTVLDSGRRRSGRGAAW